MEGRGWCCKARGRWVVRIPRVVRWGAGGRAWIQLLMTDSNPIPGQHMATWICATNLSSPIGHLHRLQVHLHSDIAGVDPS